ncbi:MAG TPA: hypothetical protein VKY57_00335 [Chitinispirillaceae bacterium]|nr:hypothetical protein [Chitinispirillaceae bacterium]
MKRKSKLITALLHKKTSKCFGFFVIAACFCANGAVNNGGEKFEVWLNSSRHFPLNQKGQGWESFQTYGVSFGVPTPCNFLNVRFTMNCGKLSYYTDAISDHVVVKNVISFHFLPPWFKQNRFTVCPLVGLTNMMIARMDKKIIDKHVFSTSENEFGLVGGVEPLWKYKKYTFAVPFTIDCVFSYPEKFSTFRAGLLIGMVF